MEAAASPGTKRVLPARPNECAQCARLEAKLAATERDLALSAEAGMQLLNTNRLLQQAQTADTQGLADQNETLLQEQHTLRRRLAERDELIATLELQLQARDAHAEALERTAAKAKAGLEARLREQQAEHQHAREQAAEAERRADALAAAEARLQRRVVQLEEEVGALRADTADLPALQAELARLTTAMQHQTRHNAELEDLFTAQLQDLQGARDALHESRSEAARLAKKAGDLEHTLMEARDQVHAFEVRLAQTSAAQRGSALITAAGESLATVTSAIEHEGELHRLRRELTDTRDRLDATATHATTLEAKLERAEHDSARHFEQLMQTEVQLERAQQDRDHALQQHQQLQQQLQEQRLQQAPDHAALEQELARAQNDLHHKTALAKLLDQHMRLQAHTDQTLQTAQEDATVLALRKQVEAVQRQAEAEAEASEVELAELQAKLARAQQEAKASDERAHALKRSAHDVIQQLRRQLPAAASADADAGAMVKVLYSYQGRRKTELSVARGEVLALLSSDNKEWWLVRKQDKSGSGFVPASYLKRLAAPADRPVDPAIIDRLLALLAADDAPASGGSTPAQLAAARKHVVRMWAALEPARRTQRRHAAGPGPRAGAAGRAARPGQLWPGRVPRHHQAAVAAGPGPTGQVGFDAGHAQDHLHDMRAARDARRGARGRQARP